MRTLNENTWLSVGLGTNNSLTQNLSSRAEQLRCSRQCDKWSSREGSQSRVVISAPASNITAQVFLSVPANFQLHHLNGRNQPFCITWPHHLKGAPVRTHYCFLTLKILKHWCFHHFLENCAPTGRAATWFNRNERSPAHLGNGELSLTDTYVVSLQSYLPWRCDMREWSNLSTVVPVRQEDARPNLSMG